MAEAAGGGAVPAAAPEVRGGLDRVESSFFFEPAFTRENTGKLEDDYTVISSKQLGEGSFGTVYRAKHKLTHAERAIKSIDIRSVKNPIRFESEIGIAKQLDHPNVVRLFETFRDARKIYLVMELCTGGELFDRIVDEAPTGFDEVKAAKYIRQILASLAYLHAQSFAHRDVKPENFLFVSEAADASLKIIDFGLACRFKPGEPMSTKAGTAYYVAPEVLKGSYNHKCDIWSAGVISFILLCGYPPFAGETDPEILKMVREGQFEFRSPEWDGVSQGAMNLVTQMMTVDPELRISADALLLSPWLKYKGAQKPAKIAKDFVRRLQSFRAHTRLKKVALTAVAQQLPDEELETLQDCFRALDKDGDGRLSPDELRQGLLDKNLSVPAEFDDLLKSIDMNASGHLDYTEFVAATMDKRLYHQRDTLWAAFRLFDLDGDGKITHEELQKVLSGGNVQKALGARKIENMIREADGDGDGAVDFDEFCAMMGFEAPEKGRGRASNARPSSPRAKRRRQN